MAVMKEHVLSFLVLVACFSARLVVGEKCTIGKTIDPDSNRPTYHTVPCRYGCCGSFPNQDCCYRLSTGKMSGAIVGGIIGCSFLVGICCQCVRHRRRTVSRRPVTYNNDFAVVTTGNSGQHPSYDVTQPPGVQYVQSPYTGQTYRPDQATLYS
ncbi:uncharacterized protein [Littorina saxatilis]|uniref:uncharacterized protein n=1 Tax=Littorina saxatilis TaxID=31220 RepID=UPI0038B62B85